MKCYGQISIGGGNFAMPQADDVTEWACLADAKAELRAAGRDPLGDGSATLLLWLGEVDSELSYPCDGYPDRVYEIGSRGGVARAE